MYMLYSVLLLEGPAHVHSYPNTGIEEFWVHGQNKNCAQVSPPPPPSLIRDSGKTEKKMCVPPQKNVQTGPIHLHVHVYIM